MADNIMETVAELRRLFDFHTTCSHVPGVEAPYCEQCVGWLRRRGMANLAALRDLPALLDHIENSERSYDYAAKSWAEERARLNERIAKMEADRG